MRFAAIGALAGLAVWAAGAVDALAQSTTLQGSSTVKWGDATIVRDFGVGGNRAIILPKTTIVVCSEIGEQAVNILDRFARTIVPEITFNVIAGANASPEIGDAATYVYVGDPETILYSECYLKFHVIREHASEMKIRAMEGEISLRETPGYSLFSASRCGASRFFYDEYFFSIINVTASNKPLADCLQSVAHDVFGIHTLECTGSNECQTLQ